MISQENRCQKKVRLETDLKKKTTTVLNFGSCSADRTTSRLVKHQTNHGTVSQPGVQQVAVQVAVLHVGQDDHR